MVQKEEKEGNKNVDMNKGDAAAGNFSFNPLENRPPEIYDHEDISDNEDERNNLLG